MSNEARPGNYRGLTVWQKSMDLVDAIYDASESWPQTERFGLTNQTRRAAISVPANIAEGKGRTGPKEFLHHLSIAHGSLCETETLLIVAQRRSYVDAPRLESLLERAAEVGRLLNGTMRSLR